MALKKPDPRGEFRLSNLDKIELKATNQNKSRNKPENDENDIRLRRIQQMQFLILMIRRERIMRLNAVRGLLSEGLEQLRQKTIELAKCNAEKTSVEVVNPLIFQLNAQLTDECAELQELPLDYLQDKLQSYHDLYQYFTN